MHGFGCKKTEDYGRVRFQLIFCKSQYPAFRDDQTCLQHVITYALHASCPNRTHNMTCTCQCTAVQHTTCKRKRLQHVTAVNGASGQPLCTMQCLIRATHGEIPPHTGSFGARAGTDVQQYSVLCLFVRCARRRLGRAVC